MAADTDRPRCGWATSAPEYLAYHDDEWGRPLHGEQALFGTGELACAGSGSPAEPDLLQGRGSGPARLSLFRAGERCGDRRPQRAAVHAAQPGADHQVLEGGQVGKRGGALEGAYQSSPCALARRCILEVDAVEKDVAGIRMMDPREQSQHGRLP